MSSGKVLLGLLAGLSAGALLGILFAPNKGSVTRKKITDTGGNYADSIKEKFEEFVEDIKERFENEKEVVEKEKSKAKKSKKDTESEMD